MNRGIIVIAVIALVVIAAILVGRHESARIRHASETAPRTTEGTATSNWSTAEPDTRPSRVTLKHPDGR